MRADLHVKIEKNELDRLTEQAKKSIEKTVRGAAFAVEAYAKMRAPVDTGFLKNSIQATPVGWTGNTVTALVNVGAEYGHYVEFGTRRQTPQPYLIPAVESVKPKMGSMVKEILRTSLG